MLIIFAGFLTISPSKHKYKRRCFHNDMKLKIRTLVILGMVGFVMSGWGETPPVPAQVQAAFRQECEALLVSSINAAKKEIVIAIYSMTREDIADALIASYQKGVIVKIKMDEIQANTEWCEKVVKKLKKAGIKVALIRMPGERHMHDKFAVIDREQVLTGSYNFTNAASTDNWENLVKITNPAIAQAFLREWQAIKDYRQK